LLAQIVIQQTMFYLIDRLLGFITDLFEKNPDQHGTADMISDRSLLVALATFDAGQLLGFRGEIARLSSRSRTHLVRPSCCLSPSRLDILALYVLPNQAWTNFIAG
jgi:hypothetical protein